MSLSDLNQPFKYSGLLSNLILCSSQILFFIPVLLTSVSLISQSIGSSCKNSSKDISSLVSKVYRDFLPRFRFSLMTCDIVEASDTADTATDISEEVSKSAKGEFWLSTSTSEWSDEEDEGTWRESGEDVCLGQLRPATGVDMVFFGRPVHETGDKDDASKGWPLPLICYNFFRGTFSDWCQLF